MTSYCQDQHKRRERAVQGSLNVIAQRVNQSKLRVFDGLLATLVGLVVAAGFFSLNADSLWQLPAAVSGLAAFYTWHNVLLFGLAEDVQRRSISEIEGGGFTVDQSARSTPLDYQLRVMLEPTIQSTAHLWDDFYSADQISADEVINFAWTPSGELGTIGLPEKPQGRFALDSYKMALVRRIDRLVALEDELAARQLLKRVRRIEGNIAVDDLENFGQEFVTGSGWLNEKLRFPSDGVPQEGMEHDPEFVPRQHSIDRLSFINM